MTQQASCFHCGTAVLAGNGLDVTVKGIRQPVCSPACRDTALWIDRIGLADFYRLRRAPSASPEGRGADHQGWRDPRLARHVIRPLAPGRSEVCMLVDGVHCSGCVWLIERAMVQVPGVSLVQVNAITRRARIIFDERQASLTQLLDQLTRTGYQPRPLDIEALDNARRDEARQLLKYLLVAGFGMMQAMMFALVLYLGPSREIQGPTLELFRWLGFLVATPVVLYSARPFYQGAARALRGRSLNMDVPIALAITLIYLASLYFSLRGGAEVYFDSISMLVFFLLIGRYLEMRARHRAVDNADALARLTPAWTERRRAEGGFETISVKDLARGDVVRVPDGGHIPADGILLGAHAEVDESLLSGESRIQRKQRGQPLIAGSVAQGAPLELEVTECGDETFLATLATLATRAQTQRPRLAQAGERAASRFVVRVLALTALTAVAWMLIDPARALDASLAVLVVSCPCAFALAVPAAITRTLSVLARHGVLVLRPDALEGLAALDHVLFDKTGTLTQPAVSVRTHAASLDARQALRLAASLSHASRHPLSKAFASANTLPPSPASDVQVLPGLGLTGTVDGRPLHLGRADFALGKPGTPGDDVILAQQGVALASFRIEERLREDARETIDTLRAEGIGCEIVSGDAEERVAATAAQLGVSAWQARRLPADKLDRITALRDAGHCIMAVGDGSNDAPVLAGADVSVALASGTELAQAQADIVLCTDQLIMLPRARAVARQARHILTQNQRWALCYNLCAMPLAALGWVPPWLAAIGMSTSSLVVVLNALRIGWREPSGQSPPVPRRIGARP